MKTASAWLLGPWLLALAVMLASCGSTRRTEENVALFGRWFVNPTAARTDSLLRRDLDRDGLAAAARLAAERLRLPAGSDTAWLRDAADSPWVLGYSTPTRFAKGEAYPLVVYLHGGVGPATADKGAEAWKMLEPLADSLPLFLASPTATRSAPWWAPTGMGRVLQAVRWMTLHFPVDPDRIVLLGVSDGAVGCYVAANTAPGPFAGFVAVSGFGGMLRQMGFPLVPGNLMQRPIYNVNGGRDRLYPIEAVNAFLDELQREGVTLQRKVYPEQEHGFDYRAQEWGTLAALLRTWKRPPERRGISWRILTGYANCSDNLVSCSADAGVAGLPAVNAFWDKGRLVVRSIGIRSITFLADSATSQFVVVANGQPQERASDRSSDVATLLIALLHQCRPQLPDRRLYSASISTP